MEKLMIIKTLPELQNLLLYLNDKDYVAYDTETTGIKKESSIIGLSVCAEEEVGYYVVLSYWDVLTQTLIDLEIKQHIKPLLNMLKTKALIAHNAIFDCWMTVNNFQVSLIESIHTDTMILAHILDENRHCGLKELGTILFGDDARKEQLEMKESVTRNGGQLTKENYELYKADADLIAKYGAKDAILTLKLFNHMVPQLIEEGLDTFFYDEESMPLLRGPTYELNTTGLKVDPIKLQELRGALEAECMDDKAYVYKEVFPHAKKKYPGTGKTNVFNIGAPKQLSWLVYFELHNEFHTLTKGGKELCKALQIKPPYSPKAKREFIQTVIENKDRVYEPAKWNPKTRKMSRPKKVGDPWNYIACGKEALALLSNKYKWVSTLLKYFKNQKILGTYVMGIQDLAQYGVIRPSFLQHGTTSGRYSSRHPNFQNLPRKDKRVKNCIVSRSGKVFVGADYSQLEPRVFASFSGDPRLLDCFKTGDDFYSVIGAEVFDKYDCSLKKDDSDPNCFANKYPHLRDMSKVVALSATYGTTAFKMAPAIKKTTNEAQEVIDSYFSKFPDVLKLMLESHEQAKKYGRVENLFCRPRRMPQALDITKIYGNKIHSELPYEARNILNLSVNHRIQSTGASIMNRAAIAFHRKVKALGIDALIVMQIHDEMIVECKEQDSAQVVEILKDAMQNTVVLPGVDLIAEPKVAYNLATLK